jgi:predicted nucleic acid-binding protein
MSAVFADTFYWIALADSADNAHRRALELTSEFANQSIVTTDEVLVEYLTFFATAHERMRRKALTNAQRILQTPGVYVVPQSRGSLLSGMSLMKRDPTRATA